MSFVKDRMARGMLLYFIFKTWFGRFATAAILVCLAAIAGLVQDIMTERSLRFHQLRQDHYYGEILYRSKYVDFGVPTIFIQADGVKYRCSVSEEFFDAESQEDEVAIPKGKCSIVTP